jgi:rsbT antagonist protein RsbS
VKIPVLELGGSLAVSVQEALDDRTALELKRDLLRALARTHARGVVVDVSGVDIVDSFAARVLGEVGGAVRLMGPRMVLVGLTPEVAMTMVELGLELPGIGVELNLARGIELLREEAASSRSHAREH